MPADLTSRDLLPDTATARRLHHGAADGAPAPVEAGTCGPKKYITIDPDAPDAPTCKPRRYITVDPDAPDAPTCGPTKNIVAPNPQKLQQALPDWARAAGAALAERHR